MSQDEFGGVAVTTPPTSDEFGGVRVTQPKTDEFGGVAVATPKSVPQLPVAGLAKQIWQGLTNPVSGQEMKKDILSPLPWVKPIEPMEIKTDDSIPATVGKEAYNLAIGIPNFIATPAGAATTITAGTGGIIARGAAAVFSAQAWQQAGEALLSLIPNWSKLSTPEKTKAIVDVGGNTIFGALMTKAAKPTPETLIDQSPLKKVAPATAEALKEQVKVEPKVAEPTPAPEAKPTPTNLGGAESDLSPEQKAISQANNSPEAFAQAELDAKKAAEPLPSQPAKVGDNLTERRAAYLQEQTDLAQPFIAKGGKSAELGNARISEAQRVVALPDAEFQDYTQDWKPKPASPVKLETKGVGEVVSSKAIKKLKSSPEGTVVGTVGDFITHPKAREVLKDVLDLPVMRLDRPIQKGQEIKRGDVKFKGATGTYQGKRTIFLSGKESDSIVTLIHEAAHELRRVKGRDVTRQDISDEGFWSKYNADPNETSANKLSNYVLSILKGEKQPTSPASPVKEAWQMTKAEFETPGTHWARTDKEPGAGHRQKIQIALAEGKPVPKEVLADYPDLASPVKLETKGVAGIPRKRVGRADAQRAPDLIDHIEGQVGKIDPTLIIEANPNWKPIGAARKLFKKGGTPADVALGGLGKGYGVTPDMPIDQFGDAINAAAAARKGGRKGFYSEERQLNQAAKQTIKFQSDIKKPSPNKETLVPDDLNEGDSFELNGAKLKVTRLDYDEDGNVTGLTLDDGKAYGTQYHDGKTLLKVDEGTVVKSAKQLPEPTPPASPAKLETKGVKEYPVVKQNATVDGREIINADNIPNMDSIAASIDNPKILSGIREVPMSDFTGLTGKHYSVKGQKNIDALAEAINKSKKITPLIVVQDAKGSYILEGSTRADALFKLGAKSFPAKVVLDMGDIEKQPTPPSGAKPVQSPVEVLNTASQVKITPPKGSTMVRVTDNAGKTSIQSLANVQGENVFKGADIKKIEAGTIGKDKKFVPMKGEVKVEDKGISVGPGAASPSDTFPEPPQAKAAGEKVENAPEEQRPLGMVSPTSPTQNRISEAFTKGTAESKLILKGIAGNSAPRTTAAHQQTGEQLARYASSKIAARPLAQTFTAHTLQDTGVDPVKLGAALTEDNLRSVREWFRGEATRLRGEGKLEESDLATAAGDKVSTIVGSEKSPFKTEDNYQDYLNDPAVKKAIAQHIQQWQEVIEPQYKAAQGIDTDVELPTRGQQTGARINLKSVLEDEEPAAPINGVGSPSLTSTFTKRSPFGIKAKGTGEIYETDYAELMANTFSRQLEIANKNKLDNMLVDNGLAEIHRPGWRGTVGGESVTAFPLKRGSKAIKTKEGETLPISQSANLYIKNSIAREYRTASNVDARFNIPFLTPTMNWLNKTALAGLTDFTIHISNQMTSLFNRPTSGKLFNDTLLSLTGRADVPVTIVKSILKGTKNNQKQIAELSEIGAMRESGKHKGILGWSGDTLRKSDQVTRLMLDDTYKGFVESGIVKESETGRREYANQIGQYNRRLQGPLTRFLRDTGFGPFVTAGKTFNALGVKVATLSPGVKAANNYAAMQLRANALSKWIGAGVLVGTLNYILTKDKGGGVSGRPGTPIGKIDTGLNDSNGKALMFPMFDVLGLSRGERVLGIRGFVEAKRMGLTTGDAMDSAARDIINANIGPAAGPPARFAMTAATGYPAAINVGRSSPVAVPGQSQARVNVQEALLQANPVVASGVDLTRGKSVMEAMSRQMPRFTMTPGKPPSMVANYPRIVNMAQTYAYADYVVGAARKLSPTERAKFIQKSLEPLSPDQRNLVRKILKQRKVH
jgi:hypothetical protein